MFQLHKKYSDVHSYSQDNYDVNKTNMIEIITENNT